MKYLTIQEVLCVGDLSDFDARLDALMNSLLDLEEQDSCIEDPDLAATLTTGRVDVQMTVEAENPAEAMVRALCALRTALHAIGDATPGWETDRAVMHVAPLEDSDRLFADSYTSQRSG